MDNLIQHIKNSINLAEKEQSNLKPETFSVPGFTSPKIRHLLNNLGNFPDLNYLEIGVHKGATFVATNFNNNLSSSIAIDNWSEFAEADSGTLTVKNEFIGHCQKLLTNSYQIIEQDCFTIAKEQIPNPINFYLYDGAHSYEAQMNALKHFYPMLADTFIYLVDDWNWPDPRCGTHQAIHDLNLKILFKVELDEGYWNGLFVSVLQK
jgi:hypothetical protein